MSELDPVAVLVRAWSAWDRAAASMPRWPTAASLSVEAAAKENAIAALGLSGTELHERVERHRHRHIAGDPDHRGMDVGSAVVAALLEMGVDAGPSLLETS